MCFCMLFSWSIVLSIHTAAHGSVLFLFLYLCYTAEYNVDIHCEEYEFCVTVNKPYLDCASHTMCY